jgi:hypothetical protein
MKTSMIKILGQNLLAHVSAVKPRCHVIKWNYLYSQSLLYRLFNNFYKTLNKKIKIIFKNKKTYVSLDAKARASPF